MAHTVVSSRYQVVIPKEARAELPLRPGQKLAVLVTQGVIQLVPIPTLEELAGAARGLDLEGYRDEEDRL